MQKMQSQSGDTYTFIGLYRSQQHQYNAKCRSVKVLVHVVSLVHGQTKQSVQTKLLQHIP